jgi:hypothetical protein
MAEAGLAQVLDLGEKPGPHHALHPGLDERAQLVEGVVEDDHEKTPGKQRRGRAPAQFTDRNSGLFVHLKRAARANQIARKNLGGSVRIDLLQPTVQSRDAKGGSLGLMARSDRRIRRWRVEEPCTQGAKIESRAAHDDSRTATAVDIVEHRAGLRGPGRRMERLARIDEVEQMVRAACLFLARGLASANVHPAIDLHGVAAHYLAGKSFGQRQPQFALPRSRRSQNRDNHFSQPLVDRGSSKLFHHRDHRGHRAGPERRKGGLLFGPNPFLPASLCVLCALCGGKAN